MADGAVLSSLWGRLWCHLRGIGRSKGFRWEDRGLREGLRFGHLFRHPGVGNIEVPTHPPFPGVVVDKPIPALFAMGKRESLRNLERPDRQLLIPRVGHKGVGFRFHLHGGGDPWREHQGPAPWWVSAPELGPSPHLDVRTVSIWKTQGHLELQANMWLRFEEGS